MGVQIKHSLDVFSISKAKHCWSFLYEPLNLVMNTDKLKSNRALELDVNGGRLVRVAILMVTSSMPRVHQLSQWGA